MGYTKVFVAAVIKSFRILKLASYRLIIFVVILTLAVGGLLYSWQKPKKAQALSTAKMLIFWDGTDASIPANWSKVSSIRGHTIGGEYPRGETPGNVVDSANSSTYGGSSTHSATVNTTTVNATASAVLSAGGATSSATAHAHSVGSAVTAGTATNEPANRSLKLIQYDGGGLPTSIPSGGIVMFDAAPGAGWTRISAQDSYFVKIDTATTGSLAASAGTGSDTHTHTITWPSLAAAPAGTVTNSGTGGPGSIVAGGHTHGAPSTTTTTTCHSSPGCLPPHVKPLLYQANSTIAAPDGIITLFDSNPGGGWAVQSNTGGVFYQNMIRPASAYDGSSSGSTTHTHADATSGATAACTSCTTSLSNSGAGGASIIHTHTIGVSFNASTNVIPPYFNIVIAKKALPSMMLFWDGSDGSIPAGWAKVTDFDKKMPRGESPGNYGDTGGSASHDHTNQTVSVDPNASTTVGNLLGNNSAQASHAHSAPSVSSIALSSSLPAYKTLKLIKYTAGGIPNIIPAGAISFFDSTPGIPTTEIIPGGAFDPYWSAYATNDGRVVAIDNTTVGSTTSLDGTYSGSDSHLHSVTWSGSLGATSSSIQNSCILCGGAQTSTTTHTHTFSGAASNSTNGDAPNQTSGTTIPPFIQVLMAKTNVDTPTLSAGLTAMFTGDPGSGWVIRSSPGQLYYKRFLRPGSTYGQPSDTDIGNSNLCAASYGCDNHTHTASKASGGPSATVNGNGGGGATVAGNTHTHNVTASFFAGSSDAKYTANNDFFAPPFFDVVIAEKVDFKLSHYRWYDDNDTIDPASPWSTLDILVDTPIPTLPVAYKPPDLNDKLRLRIQILVNNNALNIGDIAYRLQYKAGTDARCDTGTWSDVDVIGGSGIWRFATSSVTDGAALNTPASTYSKFSPISDVMQLYSKSNPTASNPRAVSTGGTMEYDFHIQHNGAAGATIYSFRIVEDGGTLLSEYTYCPTLTTKPQPVNQLRHGEFFDSSGTEKGFSWAD